MTDMPSFQDLLAVAKKGKWDDVDRHLNPKIISVKDFIWAENEGIRDTDQEVRDFAATTLIVGGKRYAIDLAKQSVLTDLMMKEPYHIVQYRLAVALYVQRNRYPFVTQMFNKALADPDVGPVARAHQQAA